MMGIYGMIQRMGSSQFILEEGFQRLVRARHGYVLYNRNDSVIGRSIETYGEYYESEVDVFRRFLAPGDVALDIGANIGTHTLAMARIVGPRGSVYAFEPQRLVFQTLCANASLNSLGNVHCVNAVVGETAGWVNLADPDPAKENNFGGAQVEQLRSDRWSPRVAQVILDDFLQVDRLAFMKVDVEGMEAQVLRGARQLLGQFMPVLYVENALPESSPQLLAALFEMGYRCFWHLPLFHRQRNYFSCGTALHPTGFVDRGGPHLDCIGFAINMICVHQDRDLPIRGLRPVANTTEHPLNRQHVHLFSTQDGKIPVLR
jgi:FkbM family methyltransferase